MESNVSMRNSEILLPWLTTVNTVIHVRNTSLKLVFGHWRYFLWQDFPNNFGILALLISFGLLIQELESSEFELHNSICQEEARSRSVSDCTETIQDHRIFWSFQLLRNCLNSLCSGLLPLLFVLFPQTSLRVTSVIASKRTSTTTNTNTNSYARIPLVASRGNVVIKVMIESISRWVMRPSSRIVPINKMTRSVYKLHNNIPLNNFLIDNLEELS